MKRLIPILVLVAITMTGCTSNSHSDPPLGYPATQPTSQSTPRPTPTVEAQTNTVTASSPTAQPYDDAQAAWQFCLSAARKADPKTMKAATIVPYVATDLTTASGVEIVSVHGTKTSDASTTYTWNCTVVGPPGSPTTVSLNK